MQKSLSLLFLLTFISFLSANAQRKVENSSDLLQEIKKLNVLCNVLYIAAHPDDENTRLIAWLENEKLARTAYLSLTRGGGGQNLIGTEKGDALGVLRTQELLEARKIDGAEQFFSRAKDFGYSKTAKETLEIWDKRGVLADIVWTIRKFQPDLIITRFPPDARAGHGHHTASAMLAEIAFELAADETAFPDQLEYFGTWQAKRLMWNTSIWWDKELKDKADNSKDYVQVNVGTYNETLGLSYSEIAADSRSAHKSQGFGSARSRGDLIEYLKHSKGNQAKNDLFDGINTDWTRVSGGKEIRDKINAVVADFDANKPSASVSALLDLHQSIEATENSLHKEEKLKSLRNIIKSAAGVYVEFLADDYNYPAFNLIDIKGTAHFICRTEIPVKIKSIVPLVDSSFESISLQANKTLKLPFDNSLALHPSNPYWLDEEQMSGNVSKNVKIDPSLSEKEKKALEKVMYSSNPIIRNSERHGMPDNEPLTSYSYVLEIGGQDFKYSDAIDYKWTDRVDGELHRNVVLSPELTANLAEKVYIFTANEAQSVDVLVEANKDSISSFIKLNAPEGWVVEPEEIPLKLNKGQQISVKFQLSPPPANSSVGEINFQFGKMQAQAVQHINYSHIKPQIMFPLATAKVVKLDLERKVKTIGYIEGSGDEVAQNLESIGYKVSSFKAEDLPTMDLSVFETIIVGIRAYNTEESLKNGNAILNDFVENGGNVIVQYNTNRGLKTSQIGPYPFRISRNRVSLEDAEVTFLDASHPILNSPNKLSKADFESWVQERGLYFADEWDEKFTPLFSWNDPDEPARTGALIVADYGKGHFMYSGISFFRQLPAGVPGAYRLLSNMISYGK